MKAIGYIIECDNHRPMMMADDGHLYFGQYVTLFRSRYQAQKAIDRTKVNRLGTFNRDFEEEFGRLSITRVRRQY